MQVKLDLTQQPKRSSLSSLSNQVSIPLRRDILDRAEDVSSLVQQTQLGISIPYNLDYDTGDELEIKRLEDQSIIQSEDDYLTKSVVYGPSEIVEKFNVSKIWIKFKHPIVLKIDGEDYVFDQMFLESNKDLNRLQYDDHWDFEGQNIMSIVEGHLTSSPDAIIDILIENISSDEADTLWLVDCHKFSHPVTNYIWKWLACKLENKEAVPNVFKVEGLDTASELRVEGCDHNFRIGKIDALDLNRFICPITKDVIQTPVKGLDNVIYESSAIASWLERNPTCPITGVSMAPSDLQPAEDIATLLEDPIIQERLSIWHQTKMLFVSRKRVINVSEDAIEQVIKHGITQLQMQQALLMAFKDREDVSVPYFESGYQQNQAIADLVKKTSSRYVVCAYDINPNEMNTVEKHLVAIVIDREEKVIRFKDSLNKASFDILESLKNKLEGYHRHKWTDRTPQQSLLGYDNSVCGVYTFQNIHNILAGNRGHYSLSNEELGQLISKILAFSNSISVEIYMHELMKRNYSTYATIQMLLSDREYPIDDIYTPLTLEDKDEFCEKEIHIKDVFSKSKKVLIIGNAGSGKTTLCKKIVYDWSQDKLWFNTFKSIVWIPLRRLNDKMKEGGSLHASKFEDPEEWVSAVIAEIGLSTLNSAPKEDVREYLIENREKILVLFDGYDEANIEVTEMLKRFIDGDKSHQRPMHVITLTRSTDIDGIRNITGTHIKLNSFSEDQADEYIDRYFNANLGYTESLKERISRTKHLLGLIENPLQLQIICALHARNPDEFGASLTDLYNKLIDTYLEVAIEKGKFERAIKEDVLNCLSEIAKYAMSKQKQVLNATDLSLFIKDQTILMAVLSSGLLLINSDYELMECMFIHLSYQEYLAAYSIILNREESMFIRANKHDKKSELILQFMAGLLNKTESKGRTIAMFDYLQDYPKKIFQAPGTENPGFRIKNMITEEDIHFLKYLNECDESIYEEVNKITMGLLNRVLNHCSKYLVSDVYLYSKVFKSEFFSKLLFESGKIKKINMSLICLYSLISESLELSDMENHYLLNDSFLEFDDLDCESDELGWRRECLYKFLCDENAFFYLKNPLILVLTVSEAFRIINIESHLTPKTSCCFELLINYLSLEDDSTHLNCLFNLKLEILKKIIFLEEKYILESFQYINNQNIGTFIDTKLFEEIDVVNLQSFLKKLGRVITMNILKAGQEENAIECFIKVFLEVKDFIEDDFIKKEVPWYISNLRFRSEIFYNGQPLVSSFIYKVYDGQIFNDYIKQLYKSSSSVIKMQRTIRGYLERKKIQKKSITEAKIQSPRFMVIQETAKDIDTGHVRRPFFPDQTKITDEDLRPYQTTITSEDFCPDQTTTTSRDTRFGLLSLYLEGKIKINKDIFDQILIHFNIHNPPIHFSYFPGGFSMQDVERKLFSDSESFKYIVSFLMKKSKYLIVFDKIRRFISQESGSTNLSITSQQNCYCIYLDKYFHRDWMAQRLEEKKIYSSLLIAHPLASPCIVRRIACIFFEKDINLYIHKLKNNLYGIYYINEGIPCYVPEKYTLEEIKGLTKLLENEQGPIISP